eukprot:jgi/Ulvmu1/7839/UM004_0069.1
MMGGGDSQVPDLNACGVELLLYGGLQSQLAGAPGKVTICCRLRAKLRSRQQALCEHGARAPSFMQPAPPCCLPAQGCLASLAPCTPQQMVVRTCNTAVAHQGGCGMRQM